MCPGLLLRLTGGWEIRWKGMPPTTEFVCTVRLEQEKESRIERLRQPLWWGCITHTPALSRKRWQGFLWKSPSLIQFVLRSGRMRIFLFRDESDSNVFAFSTDVAAENIPPVTPHTKWIFVEALDTLKFPEPWDIDDFQEVLDHVKADGYYLFQGEFIEQPSLRKRRRPSLKC
jgi:hypothetical protein